MTNAAPPGWYTDPGNPGQEHLWDGTQYVQSRPVGQQVVYYARPAGASPKSRTAASLLSFFLGGFGIDRFYLGNIGTGVAKLLLGWATAGIWPLIDFIIIVAGAAHDGEGLAVTEWS
ncbi:MAG: NINE protein [Salinibacterium sp.]|nr:NINE protein [Salinibacterium sp.]